MVQDINILRDLSLAEQLGRVSRLWKNVADKELAPLGLTHSRWTALWKLQRLGENISQKNLAAALEIELASLLRTLTQLEKQQLITRIVCPQDKRAKIICITPLGRELLNQIEAKVLYVRRNMLAQINDEELAAFTLMLEQIAHNALSTIHSLDNE
jgi:MarR family transcriptional regulator, transcriptional regulator for hemolysin